MKQCGNNCTRDTYCKSFFFLNNAWNSNHSICLYSNQSSQTRRPIQNLARDDDGRPIPTQFNYYECRMDHKLGQNLAVKGDADLCQKKCQSKDWCKSFEHCKHPEGQWCNLLADSPTFYDWAFPHYDSSSDFYHYKNKRVSKEVQLSINKPIQIVAEDRTRIFLDCEQFINKTDGNADHALRCNGQLKYQAQKRPPLVF